MDEVGFDLSSDRKTRRVGRVGSSSKSQAALAASDHITVIAAVSTVDAPVPPFIIFPGANFQESWLAARLPTPHMVCTVTLSGWTNSFVSKQWLVDTFDPATRDRAGGRRRLLIFDGLESHVQVEFLELALARNIVCLLLPAHMSGKYQPLDVGFFQPLKHAYHKLVFNYQLGSETTRVTKAFFHPWFQQAWAATANSRTIRSAWRDSGLWPLDRLIMGADLLSTPPPAAQTQPETPHNQRTRQILDRALRRGEISPGTAYGKVSRALERSEARNELAVFDEEKRKAAAELDQLARGSKKRTRFPQGQLFDHTYMLDHAEELETRKGKERAAGERRAAAAGLKRPARTSGFIQSEPGPSRISSYKRRPIDSAVVEL